MRNLKAYPITSEEVLDILRWIPADDKDVFGDPGPYIRQKLVEFLNRPEIMSELLKSMRI